jgi:hypothetical protein
MTSHRCVLDGHARDELDNLIYWALRDRVAGSSPPPRVWEHIEARVQRRSARMGGRFWAVLAQASRACTFLSAQIGSWIWPQDAWVEWRFDPCFTRLLVDQYGFLLFQLTF